MPLFGIQNANFCDCLLMFKVFLPPIQLWSDSVMRCQILFQPILDHRDLDWDQPALRRTLWTKKKVKLVKKPNLICDKSCLQPVSSLQDKNNCVPGEPS